MRWIKMLGRVLEADRTFESFAANSHRLTLNRSRIPSLCREDRHVFLRQSPAYGANVRGHRRSQRVAMGGPATGRRRWARPQLTGLQGGRKTSHIDRLRCTPRPMPRAFLRPYTPCAWSVDPWICGGPSRDPDGYREPHSARRAGCMAYPGAWRPLRRGKNRSRS